MASSATIKKAPPQPLIGWLWSWGEQAGDGAPLQSWVAEDSLPSSQEMPLVCVGKGAIPYLDSELVISDFFFFLDP